MAQKSDFSKTGKKHGKIVRIGATTWTYIQHHGNFGETPNDVILRVFKAYSKVLRERE